MRHGRSLGTTQSYERGRYRHARAHLVCERLVAVVGGGEPCLRASRNDGEPIYIPAIVVVELRYLVEKRTLIEAEYATILASINTSRTALRVAPLDLAAADLLMHIPRATVPDMPDRIIAATALNLDLPLVTRDANIRKLTNVTTIW